MAMDDLFSASTRERSFQNAPLAVRMRPNSLDEYVGQQKAVGKGSWLRAAIEHDVLSSVILYGPAGTGKTTLAHIIANHTKSEFVEVSAVTGTVKDLRRVIDEAKTRLPAAPFYSSMRFTASLSRSRMPCCMQLRTVPSL